MSYINPKLQALELRERRRQEMMRSGNSFMQHVNQAVAGLGDIAKLDEDKRREAERAEDRAMRLEDRTRRQGIQDMQISNQKEDRAFRIEDRNQRNEDLAHRRERAQLGERREDAQFRVDSFDGELTRLFHEEPTFNDGEVPTPGALYNKALSYLQTQNVPPQFARKKATVFAQQFRRNRVAEDLERKKERTKAMFENRQAVEGQGLLDSKIAANESLAGQRDANAELARARIDHLGKGGRLSRKRGGGGSRGGFRGPGVASSTLGFDKPRNATETRKLQESLSANAAFKVQSGELNMVDAIKAVENDLVSSGVSIPKAAIAGTIRGQMRGGLTKEEKGFKFHERASLVRQSENVLTGLDELGDDGWGAIKNRVNDFLRGYGWDDSNLSAKQARMGKLFASTLKDLSGVAAAEAEVARVMSFVGSPSGMSSATLKALINETLTVQKQEIEAMGLRYQATGNVSPLATLRGRSAEIKSAGVKQKQMNPQRRGIVDRYKSLSPEQRKAVRDAASDPEDMERIDLLMKTLWGI